MLCSTCGIDYTSKYSKSVCCSKQCKLIYKRKQLVLAVTRRRRKIKAMALEYKGNKCQICYYDRTDAALEFHHVEPAHKDFNIAHKGHSRSWARVKAELDKCVLVCCRCHREIHAGLHPTISVG